MALNLKGFCVRAFTVFALTLVSLKEHLLVILLLLYVKNHFSLYILTVFILNEIFV